MTSALVRGIRAAAAMARVLLLVGDRQYDRFLLQGDGSTETVLVDLEGVLQVAFPDSTKPRRFDPAADAGRSPQAANGGQEALRELMQALKARDVLLVDGELLFEDPGHPRDRDYSMLRDVEHFSRIGGERGLLCIRVPRLGVVPQVLSASPAVRKVNLSAAGRDERKAYAKLRSKTFAETCRMDLEEVATLLSNLTESWRLEEIEKLVRLCTAQRVDSRTGIEAAVRSIALGVSDSPWTGGVLKTMIKGAPEHLAKRVRGQPEALLAVCAALRKAAAGMAAAHQGSVSRGPRAVLFFAGPTGTGKTEMAKSLAELVFGDEMALIRFDCAEFRQDHAVARLIGAPPGYVGYESGGELTQQVRSRPHSVLLFDEIEKAHPRMLDLFLSILDDGRLTDGQGVTTHFDESILIFTSNLGIYEEKDDGHGGRTRVPRFTLAAQMPEIATKVRQAIREEFVSVLGRPELLGRLGGERALIVFDFLRDVKGVTEKFVDRIIDRVTNLHGVRLTVDREVIDAMVLRSSTPDALILGARGLGQIIDSELTGPLADLLCEMDPIQPTLRAVWKDGRVILVPGASTPSSKAA